MICSRHVGLAARMKAVMEMRWLASGGFQRFLAGFALGLAATVMLSSGSVHAADGIAGAVASLLVR